MDRAKEMRQFLEPWRLLFNFVTQPYAYLQTVFCRANLHFYRAS